jgi:hypothetical protein
MEDDIKTLTFSIVKKQEKLPDEPQTGRVAFRGGTSGA